MFKLDSEADLLAAFRPKDRSHVELTREVALPRFVRHYLAWPHPAGGKVFLVFAAHGGAPTGIVFETNVSEPSVPQLCDWCHGAAIGGRVGMVTARLNANKLVGVNVCRDLGCKERLEEEADRQGISAVPMLAALMERIGRFASEGLKIDLARR
jgi:hypothetical protein